MIELDAPIEFDNVYDWRLRRYTSIPDLFAYNLSINSSQIKISYKSKLYTHTHFEHMKIHNPKAQYFLLVIKSLLSLLRLVL